FSVVEEVIDGVSVGHIIDRTDDGVVQPAFLDSLQSAFGVGGTQIRKHIRRGTFLHRVIKGRFDGAGETAFGHDNGFRILNMALVQRYFLDFLSIFVVEYDSGNFFGVRNATFVAQEVNQQAFMAYADDVVVHRLQKCCYNSYKNKGGRLPLHAVRLSLPVFVRLGIGEEIQLAREDSDNDSECNKHQK